MTRKQKRMSVIFGGLAILGLAAGLVLYALSGTITFFVVPSELAEKNIQPGQRIRLGGMVEAGSWNKGDGVHQTFVVTDTIKSVKVSYDGIVPDLFKENQGVVTEGVLLADGTFKADTVLAKHDENYMPKDVADSLKAKGVKLGKEASQ
ncbi:cytochrome c maturation protein CcmE [Aestuariivirga sp.]|uniref:cytochrome c maturation protein CcmE n=1 Tax=Aestuariivirga sp. TaxID=2650926 RepID=UPI0039E3C8B3